ncbi:MAG: Hpt domain-containing protein [Campylobacterota bacterium]|nr:Hpt domain-containing protein [Campylobacterota bacterium]
MKSEKIDIPKLSTIDTKVGLSHMGGNDKLYTKILNDFVSNYENINLEDLNDEEFKRTIHTLKGLSANIGAKSINQIALEIEHTKDKTLLPKLYEELNKVISESKEKLNTTNLTPKTKESLEPSKRDQLFEELKVVVSSKRIKNINPVIEEIEKYQLESEDKELFEKVKEYIEEYEFKEAIKILGDTKV